MKNLQLTKAVDKPLPSSEALKVSPAEAGGDQTREMFASLVQVQGRRWLSVACSVLLHAGIIFGVVYCFDSTPQTGESLASRYALRVIRFEPPPLLEPRERRSGAETGAPKAPPAPAAGRASAPPAPETDSGPLAALHQARATPRPFELPNLPPRAPAPQILLQPELPPNLAVRQDIRLPELLLWKPDPAVPKPPPRKVFVAQRRPQEPAHAPNLPAPPALESPNREVRMAEAAFAGQPINPVPLLPLTPSTTAPIRTGGTGEPGPIPQIAASQSLDANSTAILSIPDIPVPPAGVFQLPAGNQSDASGLSSGGAGQSGNAAGKGGAGFNAGAISPLSGGGNGQVSGVGHGGASAGSTGGSLTSTAASGGAAKPGVGAGSPGHGFGAGDNGTGGTGAPADAPLTATHKVTKVVLPPDGHFSVLIESSGSEAFAEAEGVLSGKLVYTVYVRAGARKEWILQYCLPRAVEEKLPLMGKRPPLEAPFPFLMLRPDLTFGPDTDYLIVHGMVTVLGKLDQLTYIIAPEEPAEKELLLRSLRQWQLRPGKLDGQPVALEVLLIIPREGG